LNVEIAEKAGADYVVPSSTLGGHLLAMAANNPNIIRWIMDAVTHFDKGIELAELSAKKYVGKTVLAADKKLGNDKVKFYQASTSEIYGNPLEHPQTEKYFGNVNPIGLRSCYDEGKRCAESLFVNYHRQNNVDIKIIRIFNTYGPRMINRMLYCPTTLIRKNKEFINTCN